MIPMLPLILTLAVCGVVVLVLVSLYVMSFHAARIHQEHENEWRTHAAHNPDFLK